MSDPSQTGPTEMRPSPDAAQAPAPAPASRRNTRLAVVLSIVGVILLAIGIAGFVAWKNYTSSPGYSLGQLSVAVQKKDWDGVQKYVDVEAVVGQFVDTAVNKALESDTSGFGALAAGLAQSMKPSLVQQAKDTWRKSVTSGSSDSTGTSMADYFAAKQVKSVTKIGDEAIVTVVATEPDGKSYDVKLKMKKVDDFWRIIGIENLSDLPIMSQQ